ncbi:MAG: hypothetical protein WDA65_05105 [Christensenellales bacterium]
MRLNVLLGMLAGGAIGAAAAVVALPYLQPQLKRAVRNSRRAINDHMDKMVETSS